MAQLAALVVTHDDEFRHQLGRLLRSGGVPVALVLTILLIVLLLVLLLGGFGFSRRGRRGV